MAYGFVIDLEKCVGCHGCSVACKGANGTPPTVTRSRVDRGTEGSYPNAVRTIRPMLCMMCENPPCVAVCPQGATTIRDEDGIVVIDKEKCIGCKSCMEACPYGARYLVQSEDGYFGSELNEYESVAYENMPKMTFYRPGASACVLPLLPGAGGASCYTVRRTNGGAHGQHTEPRPGYRRAA